MNPYEETAEFVNPYDTSGELPSNPYEGTAVQRLYNRDAAYVLSDGGLSGNLMLTYDELSGRPMEQAVQEAVNKYASDQSFVVDEYLKQVLTTGNTSVVPVAQQQYREIEEEKANPVETFHTAVGTELLADSPIQFDTDVMQEEFLGKVVQQQLAEYAASKAVVDNATWVDKAGLFLNDESLDAAKLTDSNLFTVKDELRKWHQTYNSLPVAEQEAYLKELEPQILKAVDNNPIKYANFISILNSPQEDINLHLDRLFLAMDTYDVSKIALALGAGSVGALSLAISGSTVAIGRMASGAKKMERFRRIVDATNLNMLNLQDGTKVQATEVFGGSQAGASVSSVPWEQSRIYAPGLPDKIAKEMRGYSEALEYAQVLQQREQLITGGLNVSADDVTAAVAKERKRLADSPGVYRVEPLVINDEGIVHEVTFVNKELQEALEKQGKNLPESAKNALAEQALPGLKERVQYKFTTDDITDELRTEKVGVVASNLGSPNYVFGKDRDLLVQPATRGMLQREKAAGIYARLIREAQTDIKKSGQTHKVNLALKETEELPGVEELTHADLRGTYDLNDRAIEGYYKTRELARAGYYMKNNEVRDSLIQQNMRNVKVSAKKGRLLNFIGKPYADSTAANAALRDTTTAYIYKPDTYRAVKNNPATMKKYYEQDYVLVRAREPVESNAGDSFSYALVKRNNLNDLPRNVLHYIPGYIPRINKNANYFVDEITRGTLDGIANQKVSSRVVGAYSTKMGAVEARQRLMDAGPLPEGKSYDDVRFDREYTSVDLENNARMFSGGLFTGSRKHEPLLVDDVVADTEDPIASLSRYYQTLARNGTLEAWRLGAEKRWLNSANKIIKGGGIKNGYNQDFWHAIENLSPAIPIAQKRALEDMHRYISQQTGSFARDELVSRQHMRSLYESLETKKFPGAKLFAKQVLNLSTKDVPGFMRAFAFHPLLGMYSPAQLVVQGTGSLLPISMHPVAFGKGMGKMMSTMARDVGKSGAQKATQNVTDIDNFYNMWRQSGLMESVNAHADLSLLARGTGSNWDKVFNELDNATIYFRMGEYWNRLAAFGTSYELFRAANKRLPDVNNTKDLQQIIDKSFDMMMNLSTANKAKFQEGWAGVILQFQQIQGKVIENLPFMGKHLTTREKIGMFGVQAAIFGARGVPFVTQILNQVDRLVDIGTIDEETAIKLRRGYSAALWRNAGLEDIDFQGRLAVSNVQFDALTRIWSGKDFADAIARGAIGPAPQVMSKLADTTSPLFAAIKSGKLSDAKFFAGKLANIPASTRGALASYYYWRKGEIFDAKGRVVERREEDRRSWVESSMISLGFRPADFPERYEALEVIRGRGEAISHAVRESVAGVRMGYIKEEFSAEAFSKQSGYIKSLVSDFTEAESLKYTRAVSKALKNELSETEVEKAYETIFKWAFTGKGGGTRPIVIRAATEEQE